VRASRFLGLSTFAAIIAASLWFRPAEPAAADQANPHDTAKPGYCLNCHTESIYRHDCDDPAGFCLLANSVDGLCLLCHIKEDCCRLGREHQSQLYIGRLRHPSDVDVSDVKRAYLPRSLPTHNGRITCRTCHLHTRRLSGDYKMLRIVKISGDAVDWAVLCADCHEENY
jgi:hypothetical protein